MTGSDHILLAQGLSKRYGGVQALDQVDIALQLGKIIALAGQNGAGKSTLVKIISGAVQPDSGKIYVDGQETHLDSVQVAQQLGIRVVHQIPALALDLSILDNVFLGSERIQYHQPVRLPWLNRKKMKEELRPLLERFAPYLDPDAPVMTLKAHERRLVGIIKALANAARVLILDEPTAALPSNERVRLLETVEMLRDQGLAVVYVSHHLEEFEQLADEVVVLRDGRLVSHEMGRPKAEKIVTLMLGRDPAAANHDEVLRDTQDGERKPESQAAATATGFRFEITPPKGGHHVTEIEHTVRFEVSAGEIVILTGLVGSGTTEIAEAAFGRRLNWTTVFTDKTGAHAITDPHQAIALGIGYLPADRINESVLPDLSIRENMSIASLGQIIGVLGKIDQNTERRRVDEFGKILQIRRSHDDQKVTELSGGNQQKVMIGRWLLSGSRCLILNEPTQGVDVVAKAEVRHILDSFARQGGAALIVSSDPAEFLTLATRALVMRRGQIVTELSGSALTADAIADAALLSSAGGNNIGR